MRGEARRGRREERRSERGEKSDTGGPIPMKRTASRKIKRGL